MSDPIQAIKEMRSGADKSYQHEREGIKHEIFVGMATCEIAAGSREAMKVFNDAIESGELKDTRVSRKGCAGRCNVEPTIEVVTGGKSYRYIKVTPEKASEIVQKHLIGGEVITEWLQGECGSEKPESDDLHNRSYGRFGDLPVFGKQLRIALRNCGIIDPENIDEYIHNRGYEALADVLKNHKAANVIEKVKESGLRGRGGAGFPTGLKWDITAKFQDEEMYVICNADEGDPGAFMDRSTIEGDPHSVLEGMLIGAYAIGATNGIIYIRAEYPLAIKRLEIAIGQAKEKGLLGENILGSGFSFDVELRLGAGAFVCGEETALIHSIEGRRGMPKPRPPYPSESGLFGKPTLINNVETWSNIPALMLDGTDWFSTVGTEKSKGTKVFALAGRVYNTGLVEVPMGTTLREMVYDIGGGIPDGKEFKAVQTGGPSGGCLPASYLETKIDYDSLAAAGSIMGSGGMIVMDETSCMVDVAKFFLEFTQDESCGKCTPCREGTKRMLEILTRITEGKGRPGDIEKLERLGTMIQKSSLCGLGQSAPNPVLSTIKNFRDEYVEHIEEKKCRAGVCSALLGYSINDNCVGCGACKKACPVDAISGEKKGKHVIDQEKCIKCGQCYEVCKFGAVDRG
ncbi:NADP-reducing hydrogenase subunit HndC [Sedimentisphaera cyanobacteriorum]|uniref:NADP-reducing hydrogenase subunit HndC n=2 Tax=Sedimentisphaera cyanobacteriorum TaxID=1940790 RepID=A0A1Q2HMT2_9BACT|nr:NADP-reducing hydrogenase subunit HndC [Sedimentisphaera cyanobacteriorum]